MQTTDLKQFPEELGVIATLDGTLGLAELIDEINVLCSDVEARQEKTVVVLHPTPSATEDRQWPGDVTVQMVNRRERALRRLERLPVINIAVVEGTCAGPALDLLLVADFRIAAPRTRLVLPINDGHFWPGMSLYRLVQHIGLARARQIVLWGVDIPVDQAMHLGLIDQVSDDLPNALYTAAVLRARISDQETAVRRSLLLEASSAGYDEALGVHLASCDRELRRLRSLSTDRETEV